MPRLESIRKQEVPSGNFDFLFLQLMLVMMAFFILLSSMSVIVDQKRVKAISSVADAFNILPGGINVRDKGHRSDNQAQHAAKDLTQVSKLLDMQGHIVIKPLNSKTVLVQLPSSLLFEPGKTKLDNSVKPFLDILADLLRRHSVKSISIEGHTDKSPAGAGFKSNWELSAARAMTVFSALAKRNIPRQRMIVIGMGSAHQLPTQQTRGNPALNRRVEIRVTFDTVKKQPEQTKNKTISASPESKAVSAP